MSTQRSTPRLSRQSILDAATELFARGGFHGTSIADISKKLGVTKGALYYHFEGGKDEIFETALAATDTEVLAAMHAAVADAPDARSALRGAMVAKLATYRVLRDRYQVEREMVEELAATISTQKRVFRVQEQQLYAELLNRGAEAGLFRHFECVDEVARAIQTIVLTLEVSELSSDATEEKPTALFDTLFDVLFRGIETCP